MSVRGRTAVHAARGAGLLLLLGWLAPVAVTTNGCFTSLGILASRAMQRERYIPAGEAMVLAPGTRLSVRLRDSTLVTGTYGARTLLAGWVYRPRYERWLATAPCPAPALGESVTIETGAAPAFRRAFLGFAHRAVLTRDPYAGTIARLPFESLGGIRRADGTPVPLDSLAALDLRGGLCTAEALRIDPGPGRGSLTDSAAVPRTVPADDILSVGTPTGGGGEALIVLGVVADLVLLKAAADRAERDANDSANDAAGCLSDLPAWQLMRSHPTGGAARARLTDRPFDSRTGRFVEPGEIRRESVSGSRPPRGSPRR